MKNDTLELLEINKSYYNIYIFLFDRYGSNQVILNLDLMIIEVKLTNVYYHISLSSNETKFYFNSVPAQIIQSLEYNDFRIIKSFRVFDTESAKQYINFKEEENSLIRNIEG